MPRLRPRGLLGSLFALLVVCAVVFYGVTAIIAPWAFHIGGLSTPLLYWSGTGMLHSKGATYPLYVLLYPSPTFSKLHLDGLRPTGGLQGSGSLCTSRGKTLYLKLTGTVFNGWLSTDDSLMEFRLLEPKYFDVGQRQGYFDLYGRWRGHELVMDSRGRPGGKFRSGLTIDHPSITLDRADLGDFKAVCASAANFSAHR
jgi:hypothetical protein